MTPRTDHPNGLESTYSPTSDRDQLSRVSRRVVLYVALGTILGTALTTLGFRTEAPAAVARAHETAIAALRDSVTTLRAAFDGIRQHQERSDTTALRTLKLVCALVRRADPKSFTTECSQ